MCGDPVVYVVDSGMNCLGGAGNITLCSWGRLFPGDHSASFHSGVKMGTCKLGELCDGLAFYPREVEMLLMLQKTEITCSTGLLDCLACMQTYFVLPTKKGCEGNKFIIINFYKTVKLLE